MVAIVFGIRFLCTDSRHSTASITQVLKQVIVWTVAKRMDAAGYLTHFTPSLFPETFERVLHPFFGSILSKSSDARVAILDSQFSDLTKKIADIEWPAEDQLPDTSQPTKLDTTLEQTSVVPSPAASERNADRPSYMTGKGSPKG